MADFAHTDRARNDGDEQHIKRLIKKLKKHSGITYTARFLPGYGWVVSAHTGGGDLIAMGEADTIIEILGIIAVAAEDDRLIAEIKRFAGGGLL